MNQEQRSMDTPPQSGRRRTRKRLVIDDVARLANVSPATVSLAINNHPRITEATKKRVLKIVRETGYQPSHSAQSLSQQASGTLCVLLPKLRHLMSDPYFGELLSGICDQAHESEYEVILRQANRPFRQRKGHIELFDRCIIDGALCLGFGDKHEFLRDLTGDNRPAMSVNGQFKDWGMNCVVCDYRTGAEQVMRYLTHLGHQQIGLIHGSRNQGTSRLIVDVYRSHQERLGIEVADGLIADGRFTLEGGATAAARLLDSNPHLTAIFAGNDKMAIGAMHELSQRGIRIPDDVSVVGFDDLPHTAFANPPLTTVHLPLYELGQLACKRLIAIIRGEARRVYEELPTRLVLRDSTAIASMNRS